MKPNRHKLLKRAVFFSLLLLFAGITNPALAQTIKVSGRVTDKDKQPIPGVNIVIEGTTTGVSTDAGGDYSIETMPASTLVFTYIGMVTQKVAVNGTKIIHVTLLEDVQNLNEVVVIGYGTRLKGAVTGAITQTDSRTLRCVRLQIPSMDCRVPYLG